MPNKRSPEKLIAKRRAFEQQPPATKDAWLAAAANDKRVKEERKRNEEMGEDFNRARRAQYWTGVQQQAESERLERWNKALHQWDAQVNEDARHESIARQQALALLGEWSGRHRVCVREPNIHFWESSTLI